jgi:BirA family transcriptional regulator, biotin operon repressor / biotin---[acetyl-CoA-carboxylase] ligase
MSDALRSLLEPLCDGHQHSGADLAKSLGITRAAVWKRVELLRALGVDIQAASGGGYHLERPLTLLDEAAIRSCLKYPGLELETSFLVESTNASLAARRVDIRPPHALLADGQSAGRGRRGRHWLSPPGSGIFLSLAWRFQSGLTGLSALSIVVGIAAARSLQQAGLEQVRLKWPNDLQVDGRKLGGCLIDINGSAEGPCDAIIGLGINLALAQTDAIDQPWTDLRQAGLEADRNGLTADLLDRLCQAAECLDRAGFAPFRDDWLALDAMHGRTVQVLGHDGNLQTGRADGIDERGCLRLITDSGVQAISSGDVSVRAL